MKKLVKSVGKSVRARLLKLAKERREDFQLVLLRYVNERLLYRLATSAHASSFVLKGAALFTVWTGQPHRATRDLDLLGFGDATEARLRQVFSDVASMKTDDDGVVFDVRSLEVRPIREDQEYGGTRITLKAHVAELRCAFRSTSGLETPSHQRPSRSTSRCCCRSPRRGFAVNGLRAAPGQVDAAAEGHSTAVELGRAARQNAPGKRRSP